MSRLGSALGALEISDNLFKKVTEAGTKKLLLVGNSLYLSIPAGLFRIFWRKEDAINMYLLNDFTIIIVNNKAKERMEEANKININLGDTLVG